MTDRRALTILFADVSGSTRLFESRGDEAARRIIAGVLDALGDIAARHGGRVVKTIGDEIMCTFPAALNGLLAATDMQRRVKSDEVFQADNLAIRIGLHHGEAAADVRMCIGLRRRAVRGPAGVRNAEVAVYLLGGARFGQAGNATNATYPLEAAIDGNEAGRIVTAVLQPPQALEQNGDNVTLRYRADYAAHT